MSRIAVRRAIVPGQLLRTVDPATTLVNNQKPTGTAIPGTFTRDAGSLPEGTEPPISEAPGRVQYLLGGLILGTCLPVAFIIDPTMGLAFTALAGRSVYSACSERGVVV